MNLRRYDYPASRVKVWLADGRVLSESVIAHHGDTHNPASRDELVGKFTFLASDSLGDKRTRRVVDVADCLDTPGRYQRADCAFGKKLAYRTCEKTDRMLATIFGEPLSCKKEVLQASPERTLMLEFS